MFSYFLRLAYDGTDFHGWQWQREAEPTIQGELENLLSRVHGERIVVHGCGRTDAGVHASQFYAYIHPSRPVPERYRFIVNKQLPRGLTLLEVHPVPGGAQARFDATERTYDYFFHHEPDAFLSRYSALVPKPAPARRGPDEPVLPIHRALAALVGRHNFRAFCKTPDRHNTTVCDLREVTLFRDFTGNRWRLRYRADRYLRGMIRIVTHDLLEVMDGSLTPEVMAERLASKRRGGVIRQVPPEGLFLTGVRYPYLDRDPDLPSVHRIDWAQVSP